jgi:hypothetical protein
VAIGNSAAFVSLIVRLVSDAEALVFWMVIVSPVLRVPTDVAVKLNCELERPSPPGIAEADTAMTPTLESDEVLAVSFRVLADLTSGDALAPTAPEIPTLPVMAPVVTGVTEMLSVQLV